MNRFGSNVKKLREQQHYLQRQVAGRLEIDTPMLSKIERGERRAKREQVILFAEILGVDQEELMTLWLADKVCEVLKGESRALHALHVAEEEIHYVKNRLK